jgi:hypothetical protein
LRSLSFSILRIQSRVSAHLRCSFPFDKTYSCSRIYSVTNYSQKTAILTLEHNYPPGNELKALVDIELVLGSIKSHESRIGEWVNVMGYIGATKQSSSVQPNGVKIDIPVQALLIWSAGPLKLDQYQESLEQQKADATMVARQIP